jgi:hypothetical protein
MILYRALSILLCSAVKRKAVVIAHLFVKAILA